MKKYIIRNNNPNRFCHYDGEITLPFWLAGDYIKNSSGDTTHDITRAHLYDEKARAESQAKKLANKFSTDGHYFTSVRVGGLGYRYPDSVGKDGYAPFEPDYEVLAVEVSVTVVKT